MVGQEAAKLRRFARFQLTGQRGFKTDVTDTVGLVVEVRIYSDSYIGPGFLVVGTHANANVSEECAVRIRLMSALWTTGKHYSNRKHRVPFVLHCRPFRRANHLPKFLKSQPNLIKHDYVTSYGPGSSVCIATGCGLDSPGIESRWGRDFSHTSRPALGPTQTSSVQIPAANRRSCPQAHEPTTPMHCCSRRHAASHCSPPATSRGIYRLITLYFPRLRERHVTTAK
jgi:hypothetical protein